MCAGWGKVGLTTLTLLSLVSMHVSSEERHKPKWWLLQGRTLKVTTILIEPYMMARRDMRNVTGNARYYGYIADLLEELSKVVDFRYEITEVGDNSYGYKQADGTWNGMVGQVINKVGQLLLISNLPRQRLYPSLTESHYGFRPLPKFRRNVEVDIAAGPLYITEHRSKVVSFTTPFINVRATLLLRKPRQGDLKVTSVEDLINQSEIKYGTLEKGIIVRAFKSTNSTALKLMYRYMQRFDSGVFTQTNEEGIDKVRREKYAFILPDTIGQYIAQQPPCDLVTIDSFLMERGYGLALGKQSPVFRQVNKGMRILRRKHVLDRLKRKWWVDRSVCNGIKSSLYKSANAAASLHMYILGYFKLIPAVTLLTVLCTDFLARDWQ